MRIRRDPLLKVGKILDSGNFQTGTPMTKRRLPSRGLSKESGNLEASDSEVYFRMQYTLFNHRNNRIVRLQC